MELRQAKPDELNQINDMVMRSKAHWGYDADFLESCREELTLTMAQLVSENTRVAANQHGVTGVVIIAFDLPNSVLDKLFVDPLAIGTGAGRMLYDWAQERARAHGANRMEIHSDPEAQGFYERMGARLIGKTPSGSIAGRLLPLLQHDL
jgi:GNAT superfamily N-acetyltransferase